MLQYSIRADRNRMNVLGQIVIFRSHYVLRGSQKTCPLFGHHWSDIPQNTRFVHTLVALYPYTFLLLLLPKVKWRAIFHLGCLQGVFLLNM